MSSVVISGDTSGAITLSAPAVAGTNTITLPASTGTVALTTTGLSQSDQWNLTTTAGNVTSQVISANWARMAPAGFAKIGAGMTQSSGIFTFPATGLYLINAQARFYYDTARRYVQVAIETTTNNSTWAYVSFGSGQLYSTGADSYSSATAQAFLNVTDTSLCKVRISIDCQAATNLFGISNRNDTGATFIRIGDAQ